MTSVYDNFHDVELSEKQKSYFSNMQSKYYDLVSYLSEDEIKENLRICPNLHWAYSYHDKDIREDGTLKKLHCHIVLVMPTNKSRAISLIKLFNTTEIRPICTLEQLKGSFNYLIHNTNNARKMNKVQYDLSYRKCDDIDYWSNIDVTPELSDGERCISIVDDIINKVSTRVLVSKYGRDFVCNYNNYYNIAMCIMDEDNKRNNFKPITLDNDTVGWVDKQGQLHEYTYIDISDDL